MSAWRHVRCVGFLFVVACNAAPAPSEEILAARQAQEAWQWVDPSDGFTYAGLSPSCSTAPNLAADPTGATLYPADYRFLVHEGQTDKLVIYFEGGGACWDELSCIQAQSFFQAIPTDMDQQLAQRSGIFDLDNPKNPLRHWTFIVIPYCTGDIHTGARDTTYGAFTIRHRGRVNTEAVLAWALENYPDARRVLVTGSSAGGYGSRNNFDRIAELYPDARLTHLGDASTLSLAPAVGDYLREVWGATSLVDSVADYASLAARHPDVRFGLYGSERDEVLAQFRGLFCLTVPDLEEGCTGCPACELQDDVTAQLALASAAPNFRYYIAEGELHTILGRPELYTEDSAGIAFQQWFSQLVHTDARARAPRSVACAECLDTCPRDAVCPAP